jgi:hypothetical protein
MDRIETTDEIELEIRAVMREQGVDRVEAETIVGMRRGELHGDRDILVLRALTPEQRRAIGLGRSIDEVLAEQLARQNSGASPTAGAVNHSS